MYNEYQCYSPNHYSYQTSNYDIDSIKKHNYQNSMFSTSSMLSGNSTTVPEYQRNYQFSNYNNCEGDDGYYKRKLIEEIRNDYRRNNIKSISSINDLTNKTHSILSGNSYVHQEPIMSMPMNNNINTNIIHNDLCVSKPQSIEINPITEETKSYQETDKGLEQGYQEVHSIIQQYLPKQKIERNEVKEEKKEIPLPKNKEPFPVPKYKHISSLDEIAQYSKSEQIKRLYHNNLFLYEELSNLKKENELLKQQLKNKVTENDQRAKEEEDDKFKNYLVEENERLNKINKTNEKIIEGLMEKLNKQTQNEQKEPISYIELKDNSNNLQSFLDNKVNKNKIDSIPKPQSKPNRNKKVMSNSPIIPANNATNSSMNDVIINNKTVTISSTNKEEDEKIVKKVKKTKKKAMTLSSIPSKRNINSSSHNVKIEDFDIPKKKKTKSKSKTKKIKHVSKIELDNAYNTLEPKTDKQFYDYYSEENGERAKPCYACLFGINNYTKGYSPLMCSPHRYEYIKQRKNSSSQMRKNSDEDN